MKKVILWSVVLFLLYLMVQDPDMAAQLFSNTIDVLGRIAEGTADVVQGLFVRR